MTIISSKNLADQKFYGFFFCWFGKPIKITSFSELGSSGSINSTRIRNSTTAARGAPHPAHPVQPLSPMDTGQYPEFAMARRSLNNNRRLYLCTYDVLSDRPGDMRRRHLYELLLDHGEPVQYSVFLCELTESEHPRLLADARRILHEIQDQLLVVHTGSENFDWMGRLSCLGKTWALPVRSFII